MNEPTDRKRAALAAFRRKATYVKNRPWAKLHEGHGLTIDEMNAVLAERGLPPVSDEDLARWRRRSGR